MKIIYLLILVFGLSSAFCLDEWFTIPMGAGGFNQIDYSGSVLTIFPSNGLYQQIVGSSSGAASTNQVNISPPSGKESMYLSLMLSASSEKVKIMVFGSRSGALITVSATTGKVTILY